MSFLRQWLPGLSSEALGSVEVVPRLSNAVAQFFQDLSSRQHPSVLDLGRVWHSTVILLTQAGAKVYTEDLLEVLGAGANGRGEKSSEPLSARFLADNLRYAEAAMDSILAWDLFEYLPEELLLPTRERLHALLKPGGLLLALFRNRPEPDGSHRYRLVTRDSFVVMPAALGVQPQRLLQNRAILNLFASFSSSRTFVGRDNLREVLLVK